MPNAGNLGPFLRPHDTGAGFAVDDGESFNAEIMRRDEEFFRARYAAQEGEMAGDLELAGGVMSKQEQKKNISPLESGSSYRKLR